MNIKLSLITLLILAAGATTPAYSMGAAKQQAVKKAETDLAKVITWEKQTLEKQTFNTQQAEDMLRLLKSISDSLYANPGQKREAARLRTIIQKRLEQNLFSSTQTKNTPSTTHKKVTPKQPLTPSLALQSQTAPRTIISTEEDEITQAIALSEQAERDRQREEAELAEIIRMSAQQAEQDRQRELDEITKFIQMYEEQQRRDAELKAAAEKLAYQIAQQEAQDAALARQLHEEMTNDAALAQALQDIEENNNNNNNNFNPNIAQLHALQQASYQDKALANILDQKTNHITQLLNTPKHLATTPEYTVLGNTGQTGATCGSYAVINAKAMQNLCDQNIPINTTSLREQASLYKQLCTLQNITPDELTPLINQLGITIFFVDNQNGNQFIITNSIITDNNNISMADKFLTLINDIKANDAACGHFVLNTGGHWVMISIIKKQGQKAHLFYTDTGNPQGHPIPKNSIEYRFIQSIWGLI